MHRAEPLRPSGRCAVTSMSVSLFPSTRIVCPSSRAHADHTNPYRSIHKPGGCLRIVCVCIGLTAQKVGHFSAGAGKTFRLSVVLAMSERLMCCAMCEIGVEISASNRCAESQQHKLLQSDCVVSVLWRVDNFTPNVFTFVTRDRIRGPH